MTFSGMKSASSGLPFGGGFSSTEGLKIMLCVFLEGEPGPCPRLHYCFLTVPPLSLHSLPYLISNS